MLKGMDLKEKRLHEGSTLVELEPAAVQVLHELVSLVHSCVSASQDQQSLSASINDHNHGENDECEKRVTADLKDDLVAKILWDVEPQTLQYVFLAMAVSLFSLTKLANAQEVWAFLCTTWYFEPWLGCFNYD